MLEALIPYIKRLRRSNQSSDLADRLSYQYTSMLLALAAMTLAATQYVGKPIYCWVPSNFASSWEKYAETVCFLKGTYYIPDDLRPDHHFLNDEKKVLGYYTWAPLVLTFQAFLFYVPCFIWQAFNASTGINVKDVLESAAMAKKDYREDRTDEKVKNAAGHIRDALEMQRNLDRGCFSKMRKSGGYLCLLYIFIKFLYVIIPILQMIIFTYFLGAEDYLWGWNIFSNIVTGHSWEETGHFPRVTMCDFNSRVLGAIHRYTIQCLLMINMYTEKFYICLWFWVIVVGVASFTSLLYWFFAIVFTHAQRAFVLKMLRCGDALKKTESGEEKRLVSKFVRTFLTADGVLVLRMIQMNGGDLLTANITCQLFRWWQKEEKAEAEPIGEPEKAEEEIEKMPEEEDDDQEKVGEPISDDDEVADEVADEVQVADEETPDKEEPELAKIDWTPQFDKIPWILKIVDVPNAPISFKEMLQNKSNVSDREDTSDSNEKGDAPQKITET